MNSISFEGAYFYERKFVLIKKFKGEWYFFQKLLLKQQILKGGEIKLVNVEKV